MIHNSYASSLHMDLMLLDATSVIYSLCLMKLFLITADRFVLLGWGAEMFRGS